VNPEHPYASRFDFDASQVAMLWRRVQATAGEVDGWPGDDPEAELSVGRTLDGAWWTFRLVARDGEAWTAFVSREQRDVGLPIERRPVLVQAGQRGYWWCGRPEPVRRQ
jgi:hypothetical protein